MLDYIIPSKARREIMGLFFQNSNQSYHLRRVSREVNQEINAVKRELDILEKAKVLTKEKRLNKSVYTLNQTWSLYDEFLRIFAKETTIVKSLLKNKAKLGKLHYIAMSLKLAKKESISVSEVYMLFVGVVVAPEVQKIVNSVEKEYPFEINYTIMTKEEFVYRKKQKDPFIWGFLKEPKIMIVGSEAQLMV